MIRTGIIGASGYGGGELLRLLSVHPELKPTYVASESDSGKEIAEVFVPLRGVSKNRLEAFDLGRAVAAADVFFLPVGNGRAMNLVPGLLDAGKKVVDISADFRLKNVAIYENTYGISHTCPDLVSEAVYGLVELNRNAIKSARLIANPGCYATAGILSIAPLLGAPIPSGGVCAPIADANSIIVDAYSGATGAGRTSLTLDYHFPEVNDSLWAYKVIGHRHTRELEQVAKEWTGKDAAISFTPHLAPINRGILTTTYAQLVRPMSSEELTAHYREFYRHQTFVVVLEPSESPRTGAVRGSNFVHLSVQVDSRQNRATILTAEDNLVKGMCGQAIQNMNLMCGLSETSGLQMPGMYP